MATERTVQGLKKIIGIGIGKITTEVCDRITGNCKRNKVNIIQIMGRTTSNKSQLSSKPFLPNCEDTEHVTQKYSEINNNIYKTQK